MKIHGFQKTGFALVAAGVVAFSTANVFSQTTPTPMYNDITPAPAAPPTAEAAPPITPAMSQVLQLTQAKIGDSTIIAYIQNSGTIYGLNASQIVYLKQQGVSEPVINAMLNQRTAMAAMAATQPPAQSPNNGQYSTPPPSDQQAVAQPTTPAPSTTYIVPDSQTYYYDNWSSPYIYPYYGYYPYYSWYYPVGFYWGWHGGYYGGWRGGYHGGYGGGGFHAGGGFHSGGGGGGFHR
jgi:hypothetical protein